MAHRGCQTSACLTVGVQLFLQLSPEHLQLRLHCRKAAELFVEDMRFLLQVLHAGGFTNAVHFIIERDCLRMPVSVLLIEATHLERVMQTAI